VGTARIRSGAYLSSLIIGPTERGFNSDIIRRCYMINVGCEIPATCDLNLFSGLDFLVTGHAIHHQSNSNLKRHRTHSSKLY